MLSATLSAIARGARWALVACWLAQIGTLAYGQSATDVSVAVTGSGSNYDEAKSDAIRAALQTCMKQLVVTDRVIKNDSIVLDRVLSTMNGFVERYSEKSVRKEGGTVYVDADIAISASRIANFVGFTTGPAGEINGEGIFAEANRRTAQARAEELQASARAEIFDRLLTGFPIEATEVRPVKVSLDEHNSGLVDVTVEFHIKIEFVRALTSTLETLAVHKCNVVPVLSFPEAIVMPLTFQALARQMSSDGYCQNATYRQGSGYIEWPNTRGNTLDSVCTLTGRDVQCYEVDFGGKCLLCQANKFGSASNKALIVYFGIYNKDLSPVTKTGSCTMGNVAQVRNGGQLESQIIDTFGYSAGNGRTVIGFDMNTGTAVVQISAKDFDLANARKLVGVGAYAWPGYGNGNSTLKDLNPIGEKKNACDYIDEAVAHEKYQ